MELLHSEIPVANFLVHEKRNPQVSKPLSIGIFDICICISSVRHSSQIMYIISGRAGFQIQVYYYLKLVFSY